MPAAGDHRHAVALLDDAEQLVGEIVLHEIVPPHGHQPEVAGGPGLDPWDPDDQVDAGGHRLVDVQPSHSFPVRRQNAAVQSNVPRSVPAVERSISPAAQVNGSGAVDLQEASQTSSVIVMAVRYHRQCDGRKVHAQAPGVLSEAGRLAEIEQEARPIGLDMERQAMLMPETDAGGVVDEDGQTHHPGLAPSHDKYRSADPASIPESRSLRKT